MRNNDREQFTILGSNGWIGSALTREIRSSGRKVVEVDRSSLDNWLGRGDEAGHVVYAIGLTADFREKPHETIEAHVTLLSHVMRRRGLKSLLYISSSRVYSRSSCTSEEESVLCLSSDRAEIYNISKLLGESLVLQDERASFRAVRLSNVIGDNQPSSTFIGSLVNEGRANTKVFIRQAATNEKDYILMEDAVRLIIEITLRGKHRIYNVGSGYNKNNSQIASWLCDQGIDVGFSANNHAPDPGFPPLDLRRLHAEFDPARDPLSVNPFARS